MSREEFHEVYETKSAHDVRVEVREQQITISFTDQNDISRTFTVTGGELTAEFTDTRIRKLIGPGTYV